MDTNDHFSPKVYGFYKSLSTTQNTNHVLRRRMKKKNRSSGARPKSIYIYTYPSTSMRTASCL